MIQNYILNIAILSYNRPEQLKRIFENLSNYANEKICITIHEDCSPLRNEIIDIYEQYKAILSVDIFMELNEENFGYDRNLLTAYQATKSNFTMLLSDDDFLNIDVLDDLVCFLKDREPDVCFCPFQRNQTVLRRGFGFDKKKYNTHILYDSVLFSGIIFNNSNFKLKEKDSNFLHYPEPAIYSQVYLVAFHWSHNCAYFHDTVIFLGEDGDNYFGLSPATSNLSDLVNREDLLSNTIYQLKLLNVAKHIERRLKIDIQRKFLKSYRFRLYAHFLKIRSKVNFNGYNAILKRYKRLTKKMPNSLITMLVINLICLIPKKIAQKMYHYGVEKFRKSGG